MTDDDAAPDRASLIVKALEQTVYDQCLASGRLDLLDAIRTGGYELRDEGGDFVSLWVADEQLLRVRLNLPHELLN